MHVADPTKKTTEGATWHDRGSPRDARSARAVRTRVALVDALVTLINEGSRCPTIPEVARRAGVGVRTVFHHFSNMDGLYAEVVARLEPRVARVLIPLDPESDLGSRVNDLVAQRCAIHSLLAPIRRCVRANESVLKASTMQSAERRLEYVLARHASRTFAAELRGRPDRYGVLERITALTSFEVWDRLVHTQRVPESRAQRHIVVTVMREFTDLLA